MRQPREYTSNELHSVVIERFATDYYNVIIETRITGTMCVSNLVDIAFNNQLVGIYVILGVNIYTMYRQ